MVSKHISQAITASAAAATGTSSSQSFQQGNWADRQSECWLAAAHTGMALHTLLLAEPAVEPAARQQQSCKVSRVACSCTSMQLHRGVSGAGNHRRGPCSCGSWQTELVGRSCHCMYSNQSASSSLDLPYHFIATNYVVLATTCCVTCPFNLQLPRQPVSAGSVDEHCYMPAHPVCRALPGFVDKGLKWQEL